MPPIENEREYPVDPNLEFPNVVVPIEELSGEDLMVVMRDCPLVINNAEDFEWYAVINTEKNQFWHLICTPKAWISDAR